MKSIIKSLISIAGYRLEKINNNGQIKRNRFEPYECTFMGHKLYVHDYASFELGKHELFNEDVFKFKSKRQRPYIVDCGANLGMSIIYFKTLYPEAVITAFEADPYICGFLERNIKSFGFSNVEVINKAVWTQDELKMPFFREGGAGGRLEKESGDGEYIYINTYRLKKLLDKNIDFLKIDIEGAEFEVIKDCKSELKKIDHLFLEYHSFPNTPQHLHEMLEIVKEAGFRYHIREAFTSKKPFEEIKLNVGMDLQLNIFCYRS